MYLPDRDSDPLHAKHARLLSDQLALSLQVIDLSPTLRSLGVYRQLPLDWIPGRRLRALLVRWGKRHLLDSSRGRFISDRLSSQGSSWISRGNAYASSKHRLRAVILYQVSESQNLLVVGAANRTEWMTGMFSKWGCDHCADCMPLLHLYRSQLRELARHLHIPLEIIQKPADPDLLPGLGDKGALLGSFQTTDLILWALENQFPDRLLKDLPKDKVDFIRELTKTSRHMREAPYSLL